MQHKVNNFITRELQKLDKQVKYFDRVLKTVPYMHKLNTFFFIIVCEKSVLFTSIITDISFSILAYSL